jgi:MFS family permease
VPSLQSLTRSYKGLPKAIWTLFLTETIMAAGSFVYPFLAFVLTRHFRMTEQQVGLLMAVSAVACLLGTAIGGVLADGASRKRALLGTMTISALAYAAVPLVHSASAVSLLVVLGLGSMAATKPAFDALVSDLTFRGNRRAAFSLLYAAVNIGFAAGPIVASILFSQHIRWLFLGDAAATLAAAGLIALLVRGDARLSSPPGPRAPAATPSIWQHLRDLLPTLKDNPTIITMVVIYTLNVALFAQIFFALPLCLSAHFGIRGANLFGLVMTVNALAAVVLTPAVTWATRRLSPGNCLAIAGLLFAVGLGGYGMARSLVAIFALVLVWTLGELLNTTNARVFVADLAPRAQRGRLGALVEFAHELGFGIGPAIAGYTIAHRGVDSIWPYLASLGLASGLTMALIEWHRTATTKLGALNPLTERL